MAKDIIFVGIQVALLVAYIFHLDIGKFTPPSWLFATGSGLSLVGVLVLLLAMLQLNKSLSPFPTPKSDGELITSGLFKFVRHPIYSGILVFTLAYALREGNFWRLGVALLLYLLFHFKARYEETLLKGKYPDYEQYMRRTGRFFPRVRLPKSN